MASTDQIGRGGIREVEEGLAREKNGNGEERGKQGRYNAANSKLPLASAIDDAPTQEAAVELLKEARSIKTRHDRDQARLDEIRDQLCNIAEAFTLPGFRHGRMGLEYRGMKTRMLLDKMKLIENGVSPETIKASYSESRPFRDSRFVEFE